MKIRFLGAHSSESAVAKYISLLIDDRLVIDAGAITNTLSLEEQREIEAVLLTHQHYDHIRDIPTLARNMYHYGGNIDVWATTDVRNALETHLLNGIVYPRFQNLPAARPTVNFRRVLQEQIQRIDGHQILAVPVKHCAVTVGYQVSDDRGNTLFYTADTGPGLERCWACTSPQLLIIDVTLPNSYEQFARKTGHLTPRLLHEELTVFLNQKGYLPQVVVVHMDATLEAEIQEDIKAVTEALELPITVASEGMEITLDAETRPSHRSSKRETPQEFRNTPKYLDVPVASRT